VGSLFFRRSKSFGPLRFNLTKHGVGASIGVPGLRWSVHSSGRSTRTVGIPGTGLYYRDQHGPRRRAARTARPAPSTAHRRTAQPRAYQPPPGWLPDPSGRFEWRWWTGAQWSGRVASHGVEKIDTQTS
jgi:hypothetical protein